MPYQTMNSPHWIMVHLEFLFLSKFFICASLDSLRALQVAHWWRICLPMHETQEMRVWSLAWEDPLEEEMVALIQCSCLENPTDRRAWQLQSSGSQRVRHRWVTEHTHTHSCSEYLNFTKGLMLMSACIICSASFPSFFLPFFFF